MRLGPLVRAERGVPPRRRPGRGGRRAGRRRGQDLLLGLGPGTPGDGRGGLVICTRYRPAAHPDRRRSWRRPGRVGPDRPPDCLGRQPAGNAEPESGASNAGHWGPGLVVSGTKMALRAVWPTNFEISFEPDPGGRTRPRARGRCRRPARCGRIGLFPIHFLT